METTLELSTHTHMAHLLPPTLAAFKALPVMLLDSYLPTHRLRAAIGGLGTRH